MDKSLRLPESNTPQPGGFSASLQTFDGILHWLVGLIQLTEEEQMDAGIYVGYQP